MDYFSEECIGTEFSVNPDGNEGAETEKDAYKKALLDILSSLEWIDVVTTVVDKVSKENQLLTLPTGLCDSCFFTRRGVVGRHVKMAQLINIITRNFYRVLVTLLSRVSVKGILECDTLLLLFTLDHSTIEC